MKKRSSMLKKATSLALALTFATTAMSLPAFAQSVDSSPNAVGTTQSGTLNSSANVPADVKPVKTYTVELGKTYKLPADVKQAGDGYSPSNSSILKVDGATGNFTTLSNGTAYIVVANNGKTRYIKVIVGNGTTATNTATQTKSLLTGYTVTVNDKTTLATSSGSKEYPVKTYYFYSANGTVLGSISGDTFNKVISAANKTGSTSEWLTAEFNTYRGLSGSSTGTATGGNTADNAGNPAGNSTSTNINTEEQALEVIRLINIEREKVGLHPLEMDTSLNDHSRIRAKELSIQFSHTRPNGIVEKSECATMGVPNASGAVQAWMKSDPHRNAILNEDGRFNYNYIGAGCYQDANGKAYWIITFSV